jgi:hypothetical protein
VNIHIKMKDRMQNRFWVIVGEERVNGEGEGGYF